MLNTHLNILTHREKQIKDEIMAIGKAKLGSRAIQNRNIMSLIDELNKLEKQGLLSESKIKDELQSYDILENERYSRLK